jgi:hypothetical protein
MIFKNFDLLINFLAIGKDFLYHNDSALHYFTNYADIFISEKVRRSQKWYCVFFYWK